MPYIGGALSVNVLTTEWYSGWALLGDASLSVNFLTFEQYSGWVLLGDASSVDFFTFEWYGVGGGGGLCIGMPYL